MKKKIVLACTTCQSRNYKTNKSQEERLTIKKFCKKCKEHTIHCEEK